MALVLYHVADRAARTSIEMQGLQPRRPDANPLWARMLATRGFRMPSGVYCWRTEAAARSWADTTAFVGARDVWEVHADTAVADDPSELDACYVADPVSPTSLRRLV